MKRWGIREIRIGASDRFGRGRGEFNDWHNWGYRDCRVHKQAFRDSKYSYYIPHIYDLLRPLRLSLFALNSKTKPTNLERLKHREHSSLWGPYLRHLPLHNQSQSIAFDAKQGRMQGLAQGCKRKACDADEG